MRDDFEFFLEKATAARWFAQHDRWELLHG